MSILNWFKRKNPRVELRLAQLLSTEELAFWRALEERFPQNRLVPLTPLALLAEGDMPEALAHEVVPFVVVDDQGWVVGAVFYSQSDGYRLLKELGIECHLIDDLIPETIQAQASPEGNEAAGVKEAPPPPSASAKPDSTPKVVHAQGASNTTTAPQNGPEADDQTATPSQDLATLWWRGEVGPEALINPGNKEQSSRRSSDQTPRSSQRASRKQPSSKPTAKAGKQNRSPSPNNDGRRGARTSNEDTSAIEPPKCPLCGAPMVLKVARRGRHAGQEFWGCTKYPACKGVRPKR